MKILIDDSVPPATRVQMERLVIAAVGDRPGADTLVVSLVKLSPGRGWEVFINDLRVRARVHGTDRLVEAHGRHAALGDDDRADRDLADVQGAPRLIEGLAHERLVADGG